MPRPTERGRKEKGAREGGKCALVPSFPLPDKLSERLAPLRTAARSRSASLGAAVFMGVPSFYAWVKKRYPLMVQHVHHTCSDSPDGQAGHRLCLYI